MLKFIKTNLSKAYWCRNQQTITNYESAKIPKYWKKNDPINFFELNPSSKEQEIWNEISWFDSLFEGGGIKIPDDTGKPLTILISGPPGSGKSTISLELCLRLAINHGFWSLYISTESITERLIDKINSLKIENSKGKIFSFDKDLEIPKKIKENKNEKDIDFGALTIYGQENIKKWETFSEIVELALDDITQWLLKKDSKILKWLYRNKLPSGIPNVSPDVLVFDSLNMVEKDERSDLFEKIINKTKENTKLIIVILDSNNKENTHENWEFACDNIIRLDYNLIRLDSTSMRDYYVRHIEVIKARYQAHVWGKQQMKIYPSNDLPEDSSEEHSNIMRRSHPYRKEGGIFIYPSIHNLLSKYKKQGALLDIKPIPTPCKGLNQVIDGFPEGRCTALLGVRGGHKSHLGYLHILDIVVDSYRDGGQKEAGLIISLRDDEQMTKQHMIKILREKLIREELGHIDNNTDKDQLLSNYERKAELLLNVILKENLLEILYYPPGYITPDEFFHRMFMSVFRFKNDEKNLTLLFNSLDQISARFPLCAHQPIFIPAMIQSLSGEKVTSIFVAVDEPGQPPTQYGLLPMADLILTFKRYKILEEDYFNHHKKKDHYQKIEDKIENKKIDAIILEVTRFSGGQQAGTKGLLELVYSDKKSNSLYEKPGLYFKTWEYKYFKLNEEYE